MDVPMEDVPTEAPSLIEEDRLRQIARHVKQYIPDNGSDDINEQKSKLISLFDEVIQTCSSASLNAGHRVAAWNALCALIDQTIASQNEDVRMILWQAQIWNRGLRLYIDQSHNARPKSSKQLLASLSAVLKKCDGAPWVNNLKEELSMHLVVAVSVKEVHRDSKANLLLFSHLLSKNVVSIEMVLSQVSKIDHSTEPKAHVETLLSSIFQWATKGDYGSIVGQLIAVVLDQLEVASQKSTSGSKISNDDNNAPIWSGPLHRTLGQNVENTEAYRSHIFPVLFKRSLSQYAAFLHQLGLESLFTHEQSTRNENSEEILYAALQTGKNLGLIEETTGDKISLESNRILIPVSYITQLISSGNRSARLAGLSLFIASLSPTKPFQSTVLEQLKYTLSHLHADSDAFFRSELFSLTQRMFDRIRAATAGLARDASKPGKSQGAHASLEEHKDFIRWYLSFITWELRPTSNYQRHISGLKCLALLLRSGVDSSIGQEQLSKSASGTTQWPFQLPVVDLGLRRLLLDLLMDPYDDVRQTAAGILELCTSSNDVSGNDSGSAPETAKERAIAKMLSSGRADHADGVAYLHGLSYVLAAAPEDQQSVLAALLDKTEEMLSVADQDLARAVDKFPLHGLLTSLRYVLLRCDFTAEVLPNIHNRVERILHHVWAVVKPTLCDDAPEGHMPEEMDDMPDITSKDILSYCWRALKEASLLMGTMLSPPILKSCPSSAEFKQSMFEACFTQLGELRHRGAFSTVAQTWTTCCSLMEDNDSPLGLSTWYDRTIGLLRKSLTINTRRSAGLPSLLCGVLIADRSGALFKRAFSEFEQIAREAVDSGSAQEGSLPQVHAMNCMKDVLKNTRLADKSELYVPVALRLAADSLRSEAWAIRNCGLMLFRAVIDRLLGTNDAYVEDEVATKRRVDFEHHHDLLELVIGLLATAPTSDTIGEGARNEGVFPALQLLQRAHMPEAKRAEVQTAVFALTKSPSWHVRDKAARTYVSFVPVETTAVVLEQLLAESKQGHNALHGVLLCAVYLVRRLNAKIRPLETHVPEYAQLAMVAENCKSVVAGAEWLRLDESCLYTSIAFVDVELAMEALIESITQNQGIPTTRAHTDMTVSTITLEGDHAQALSPAVHHLREPEAMHHISNQTEADRWLVARAAHIESTLTASPTTLLANLKDWSHAAQTALTETSIFSSQAAVRSLALYNKIWPVLASESAAEPLFRSLCLTVYDLLNDDDEDIRIEAAATASKILSAASGTAASPQVPLVATRHLAALIAARWPLSADLFETAISRAFGPRTQSVAQQLHALQKDAYALFAEEKQNLYVDDAREIRLWATVAMRLSTQESATELHAWTLDGLEAFRARFERAVDGPLGWSTDGEAFLLGLRVVCAAGVLLVGGREADAVREGLESLLASAKASGGNVLLIGEVERVLGGEGVVLAWEEM